MTIRTDLDQQWQALQQTGGGRLDIAFSEGRVAADLPVVDRVGCQCRELRVSSAKLAGISTTTLRRVADGVAGKLTYLLEPLQVVEIDGQAQLVQIRSVPPSPTPSGSGYYEVLVQEGGSITLNRFTAPRGRPRQLATASFTREVFERLVQDLVDALP